MIVVPQVATILAGFIFGRWVCRRLASASFSGVVGILRLDELFPDGGVCISWAIAKQVGCAPLSPAPVEEAWIF